MPVPGGFPLPAAASCSHLHTFEWLLIARPPVFAQGRTELLARFLVDAFPKIEKFASQGFTAGPIAAEDQTALFAIEPIPARQLYLQPILGLSNRCAQRAVSIFAFDRDLADYAGVGYRLRLSHSSG